MLSHAQYKHFELDTQPPIANTWQHRLSRWLFSNPHFPLAYKRVQHLVCPHTALVTQTMLTAYRLTSATLLVTLVCVGAVFEFKGDFVQDI